MQRALYAAFTCSNERLSMLKNARRVKWRVQARRFATMRYKALYSPLQRVYFDSVQSCKKRILIAIDCIGVYARLVALYAVRGLRLQAGDISCTFYITAIIYNYRVMRLCACLFGGL